MFRTTCFLSALSLLLLMACGPSSQPQAPVANTPSVEVVPTTPSDTSRFASPHYTTNQVDSLLASAPDSVVEDYLLDELLASNVRHRQVYIHRGLCFVGYSMSGDTVFANFTVDETLSKLDIRAFQSDSIKTQIQASFSRESLQLMRAMKRLNMSYYMRFVARQSGRVAISGWTVDEMKRNF